MCVSVTDDILYIHGGYSKEKVSGQKKEGRVHEDMYVVTPVHTERFVLTVYTSSYCTLLPILHSTSTLTFLYRTLLYCKVLFSLVLSRTVVKYSPLTILLYRTVPIPSQVVPKSSGPPRHSG
jgi:hypothetical protein